MTQVSELPSDSQPERKAAPTPPSPAWYPNPADGRRSFRWWTGSRWTTQRPLDARRGRWRPLKVAAAMIIGTIVGFIALALIAFALMGVKSGTNPHTVAPTAAQRAQIVNATQAAARTRIEAAGLTVVSFDRLSDAKVKITEAEEGVTGIPLGPDTAHMSTAVTTTAGPGDPNLVHRTVTADLADFGSQPPILPQGWTVNQLNIEGLP